MKKPYFIGLAGLLAASAIFAACGGGPARPTATPTAPASTATPAATVTPPPTPTPPLGARDTAGAYLAAWQQANYAAMYALLAPASRAQLSAADFEAAYRKNLDIISATAYTPTVTNISETGDTAEAPGPPHLRHPAGGHAGHRREGATPARRWPMGRRL